MKTALVTGAMGFQGGAVVDALLKKNYQVKGLVTGEEDPKALLQKGV
jgi:uncharacterized protein YbjT (DUF2867 family)